MTGKSSSEAEEKVIPVGLVMMVVGLLILLIVVGVWAVSPQTMPQPIYALVAPYLSQTAVSLPTPASVAVLPTAVPTQPGANPLPSPQTLLPTPIADLTAGLPTRIVIPTINLDAPVVEVGVEPVVANGTTYYQWLVPNGFKAGWHDGSARLGQPGNTVLNGHHNVFGEVFRDLINLAEGDEIILYDDQVAFVYRVTEVELLPERDQPLEIRLENAQWIAPTADERITLVTCWPYTDNTHRLVVVAQPTAKGITQQNQ